MTIADIKALPDYGFEVNISEADKANITDLWAAAVIWIDDIGVEYNFCQEECDGEIINQCAIYKTFMDDNDEVAHTDYCEFEHYEIDWSDAHWKERLEDAMCQSVINFHF